MSIPRLQLVIPLGMSRLPSQVVPTVPRSVLSMHTIGYPGHFGPIDIDFHTIMAVPINGQCWTTASRHYGLSYPLKLQPHAHSRKGLIVPTGLTCPLPPLQTYRSSHSSLGKYAAFMMDVAGRTGRCLTHTTPLPETHKQPSCRATSCSLGGCKTLETLSICSPPYCSSTPR